MKRVLLLILAAVLLIGCAACAKKETKTEMYSFTIYNRSGSDVTQVAIKDNKGNTQTTGAQKIPTGSSVGMSINAVLDDSGKPDLTLSFSTAEGVQRTTSLTGVEKTTNVTLQKDGVVDFNAPED